MTLYHDLIMDHYRNPRNFDCKNRICSTSSSRHNPSCGDKIDINVKIVDNTIVDICFDGFGCALSTASASMLTEYVKGKSIDEVNKLNKEFVVNLLGIEVTPIRLKCALLPLETIQDAIK